MGIVRSWAFAGVGFLVATYIAEEGARDGDYRCRGRDSDVVLLCRASGFWRMQHHLVLLVVDRYGDGRGGLFVCLRIHIVIVVVGVIIAWASLPETLRSALLLVGWVGCLYCTWLLRVVVSSPPLGRGCQPIVCLCPYIAVEF